MAPSELPCTCYANILCRDPPSVRHEAEWPAAVESLSQTLAILSHPAAIYWGKELVLFHNRAWGDVAGGADKQRTRQRYALTNYAVTTLRTVSHGGEITSLRSRDLFGNGLDETDNHVMLSQVRVPDNGTHDATGVLAQLAPRVHPQGVVDYERPSQSAGHEIRNHGKWLSYPRGPSASAQQLANILPVGLVITNHRDELVFINQRFQDRHTQCNGKHFDHLSHSIHPDDYERVEKAYHEAFKSKRELRIQYRVRGEDDLWRLLVLNPLDDADMRHFNLRERWGSICTIVDITAEKTAELTQAKVAQEAQNRKQQQERFIDMISHEVRNPLSAILHCTEDIVEAVQGKKAEQVNLDEIIQATEIINLCIIHQKKVVDDVLSFSKLDASMLTLAPRSVLPRVDLPISLKIFQPELRNQNIHFEYRLDYSYLEYGIQWVMTDLTRVSQVVINLFSNAIKFTSKKQGKKKIAFSMGASVERPPSYPPNIVFFHTDEAARGLDATNSSEWGSGQVAYIMVAVDDTGIGISDESQKRLFERFNQATPRTGVDYGGSGLGLNVCRKLCHLHGGDIGVSSKEGHGSTFGFFFKVRRSRRPSDVDTTENELGELGNQLWSIGGDQAPGPVNQADDSEVSVDPIVTRSSDVMPNAKNDERTEHTLGVVHHNGKFDDNSDGDGNDKNETAKRNTATQENQPEKQEQQLEKKEPPAEQRKRILVVEDNIINQRIISRKLKSFGFDASEANDGREALYALEQGKFDCVLMDKEMPVMDGNAATRAIRQLENKDLAFVPILGVTANARASQQTEMEQAGMDGVIHKPYRMEDLVKKIRRLMEKER